MLLRFLASLINIHNRIHTNQLADYAPPDGIIYQTMPIYSFPKTPRRSLPIYAFYGAKYPTHWCCVWPG